MVEQDAKIATAGACLEGAPVGTLAVVRAHLPLTVELLAARTAGALSRLAGRGGGTTLPGKLLWKLDPGAIDRLAGRLVDGSVLYSATNGKTTTVAMAAEIVRPHRRVVHNSAGANLVSGVASSLLAADGATLGVFEVDEGALPEVARRLRPRAIGLGNLFRDQLDRYGELEHVAERWRATLAEAPEALAVVNADDPLLAELTRDRAGGVLTFGLDDPGHARGSLQHAADSKYCFACGAPFEYAAVYVGHLGDYRCPNGHLRRPPLDVAATEIELDGVEGCSFRLVTPQGTVAVSLALPGLYNVYTATAAAALAVALELPPAEIAAGLERSVAAFGRFERIAVGDRRLLMLLIKNPAGANEAVRALLEGDPPRLAVIALNDAIADGRDVSWIWDVDFEPLLSGLDRLVAAGDRAAELALRFAYGGLARDRIEVVTGLEEALDRGLALTPAGGELVVLPTYTAMLALRRVVARRGLVPQYWERAA
jgi:UDP-N-acetylmuramyl tripeptide synthase